MSNPAVMPSMVASKPSAVRVRQGLLLLAGGLALELLVAPDSLRFYWMPLIIGLTYLAAAAAGGRKGGYWATACVLVGWGLSVVLIGEIRPREVDVSGAYLLGAGIGASVGALLIRAKFEVGQLGLGVTVAAAGLLLALVGRSPEVLGDARTYALALGAVGVFNVLLGALRR